MKTYQGMKTFDGDFEIQVVCADSTLPLTYPGNPGWDSWSWGVGSGSGWTGTTAFAILADALQDSVRAKQCYEEFSEKVMNKLDPNSGWTLDYYAIVAFVNANAPPSEPSVELL